MTYTTLDTPALSGTHHPGQENQTTNAPLSFFARRTLLPQPGKRTKKEKRLIHHPSRQREPSPRPTVLIGLIFSVSKWSNRVNKYSTTVHVSYFKMRVPCVHKKSSFEVCPPPTHSRPNDTGPSPHYGQNTTSKERSRPTCEPLLSYRPNLRTSMASRSTPHHQTSLPFHKSNKGHAQATTHNTTLTQILPQTAHTNDRCYTQQVLVQLVQPPPHTPRRVFPKRPPHRMPF